MSVHTLELVTLAVASLGLLIGLFVVGFLSRLAHHQHRWSAWKPWGLVSYRSRCWCGAERFTRTREVRL